MASDLQQVQEKLVEQALADPRIADALRAYEAVRPFVPEHLVLPLATTYSTSTIVTSSETAEA